MVSKQSSHDNDRDAVTFYYLAPWTPPPGTKLQDFPVAMTVLGLSWPTYFFRRTVVETDLLAELLFELPRSSDTLMVCRTTRVGAAEFEESARRDFSVILPAVHGKRGCLEKVPVFAVRKDQRRTFACLLERFWCVRDGHWLFVDWPAPGSEGPKGIDLLRSEPKLQGIEEKGWALLVKATVFGITYDDCMVNVYIRAAPEEVREVLTVVARRCGAKVVPE